MYDEQIKAAYEKAGHAYHEAKALLDLAEITPEQAAQADAFMTEAKTAQEAARRYEQAAALDTQLATPKRLPRPGESAKQADTQAALEVKAFNAYLHGERLNSEEKAALNIGTAGQGGYLTPDIYTQDLVKALYDQSIMRMVGARQITLQSDSTRISTLTASAAAVLTTEAAAFDEKEPTFGEAVFVPYKYTRLAKASDEVVADSRFDIWGMILGPDFAQAFANAENTAFVLGSGSSQPEGILVNAPAGVTLTTGQTTTISSADSIYGVQAALDYKYRANAKWLMNDSILQLIRKMKDSQNRYLFEPSLQAGVPDMLLGKPVVTCPTMPAAAANKQTIVFGDFSYYWIGDRAGLEVKVLNELYAGNGQVGFRAYKRFDAHLMLPAAVTTLVQSAT